MADKRHRGAREEQRGGDTGERCDEERMSSHMSDITICSPQAKRAAAGEAASGQRQQAMK